MDQAQLNWLTSFIWNIADDVLRPRFSERHQNDRAGFFRLLPHHDPEQRDGPKQTAHAQRGVGGRKSESAIDKLSNIIRAFNDQFGGLFNDPKSVEKRILEVIPPKVSEDTAFKNAKQNSDRQNARIEHNKALKRVITAMFKDDAQLFKQFQDNDSFRRWLTDAVFGITYED